MKRQEVQQFFPRKVTSSMVGLTATLALNTFHETTAARSPPSTTSPNKRIAKVYVWGHCMTSI